MRLWKWEIKKIIDDESLDKQPLQKSIELLIKDLKQIIVEARRGSFGFMIRDNETLQQGMSRNYHEFHNERTRLNTQIKFLKEMVVDYKMENFCYSDIRSAKQHQRKLLVGLDALLLVKEAQDAKTKAENEC